MAKEIDSTFDSTIDADLSREELTSVMTALEPDQIISTKEHHHCPRRRLTRTEMILFWALRIYLVFMVGVVVYQIWTGVR
jgi:hypothetical protein